MKKYICSFPWAFIESDVILPDCSYYVEVKNIDKRELAILKRCSSGSKAENEHLGNIFRDNEVKTNYSRFYR